MPADKCYTKKNNNGGSYTTCVNKKGDQLREKDVKPKKKKLVLKVKKEEPAKPAPLQNVSAITAATSASAPKAAPPANYNMLRPEIRKHIIGYIRDEEFSPSKMKKAQIDRMYGMIEDDEAYLEVQHDRFNEHLDYGGEYREGYFQDKYGDTHLDRYDRADTKFRKQTKTGFISFLKEGGDTRRTRVPGKYDKKTIKELRDVYFDDY